MKEQRSYSGRKGVSVSLSKKNSQSLPKRNCTFKSQLHNQLWQIPRNQPMTPYSNPQGIEPRPLISVRNQQRPSVIIYRYRKSQWQQLQQTNKTKRETVNKMKYQLQSLKKQIQNKQNQQLTRQSLTIHNRPTLSQRFIQAQNITIKQVPKRNIFKDIILDQPLKQIRSKLNRMQEQPIKQKQQKQLITNNKNNEIIIQQSTKTDTNTNEQNFNCINEQKNDILRANSQLNLKQVEKVQQQNKNPSIVEKRYHHSSKRIAIDINSLLQLQNRINKLIDFTKF